MFRVSGSACRASGYKYMIPVLRILGHIIPFRQQQSAPPRGFGTCSLIAWEYGVRFRGLGFTVMVQDSGGYPDLSKHFEGRNPQYGTLYLYRVFSEKTLHSGGCKT